MTGRELFLAACRGAATPRAPVWIMRQAGRVLPEYRELRQRHSFWEVCRRPELAAEVTLQPLRRFPLDAAILFSDILVLPAAMGLRVDIHPHLQLDPPIRSAADLARLRRPDPAVDLAYMAEALRAVRPTLGGAQALIGFAGAPFTLACYMIEGGGGRHFSQARGGFHARPDLFDQLMGRLSEAVGDLLEFQLEAGADVVQIFDTWAGELSPEDYRRAVLPHLAGLVARLRRRGAPVILYSGGSAHLLELAAASGPDVLGLDWRVDLAAARARLGPGGPAVQGNLDPAVLASPTPVIWERTRQMVEAGGGRGHIANLGHGLLPDTPLEGVAAFVDAVHAAAGGR